MWDCVCVCLSGDWTGFMLSSIVGPFLFWGRVSLNCGGWAWAWILPTPPRAVVSRVCATSPSYLRIFFISVLVFSSETIHVSNFICLVGFFEHWISKDCIYSGYTLLVCSRSWGSNPAPHTCWATALPLSSTPGQGTQCSDQCTYRLCGDYLRKNPHIHYCPCCTLGLQSWGT